MLPRHRIVTSVVSLALLAACASDPPPVAHPMRPIPEERARQLIAHTFESAGIAPEANRTVLVKEHPVLLDVAGSGRRFGVAYLTPDDWAKAAGALPPRPDNGALVVAVGEGGTRILCLYAGDYGEDDDADAQHRTTTIAADRRLDRDVRDFLHRAQVQGWP